MIENIIPLPYTDGEYKLEEVLTNDFDLKINSSIEQYHERYYCAYRTDHMDEYDANNFLTELDLQFQPLRHIPLRASNGNTAFEDIRLFVFRERLLAIYTYLPKTGDNSWVWHNGIGIAEIDINNGLLIHQQSLRGLAKDVHEKNYIPYVYEGELYVMASCDPSMRIIKIEGEIGDFSFREIHNAEFAIKKWRYGQLRGGTPFINSPETNDSWLYSFLHSSIYLPNGNHYSRFYFYTVCRFDPISYKMEYYLKPLGYSSTRIDDTEGNKWILKSNRIGIKVVFPMGIINYKDGLLISYGKDDCVSRLKYYNWYYIQKLFEVGV